MSFGVATNPQYAHRLLDVARVNNYKRIAEELEGGLAKQSKKDYTKGIEAA